MTIENLKTWIAATAIFATGGIFGTVVLPLGQHVSPAMAQEPPQAAKQPPAGELLQTRVPSPVQRYQVASWSHPAATRDTGGFMPPSHGAYILDTQSGKVWLIKEGEKPKALGGVD